MSPPTPSVEKVYRKLWLYPASELRRQFVRRRRLDQPQGSSRMDYYMCGVLRNPIPVPIHTVGSRMYYVRAAYIPYQSTGRMNGGKKKSRVIISFQALTEWQVRMVVWHREEFPWGEKLIFDATS